MRRLDKIRKQCCSFCRTWCLGYCQTNLVNGCHGFNSFKSYKTIQQGIIGVQGFSGNLKVYDVETMDTGKGISLIVTGGGDKTYASFRKCSNNGRKHFNSR